MRGPCVKRTVVATIVTRQGKRYAGSNACENAQTVCPRASMPTGVGYELCKSVCRQPGHAEAMALVAAFAAVPAANLTGSICYVQGHTYACKDCTRQLFLAGVTGIFFEAPPAQFGHSGMDSMLDSSMPQRWPA